MPKPSATTLSPASIPDIPRSESLIGLPDLARTLRVIVHLCGMAFVGFVMALVSVGWVWADLESPSGSLETSFTNVLDWLSGATLISFAGYLVLTLVGAIVTRKINRSSYTAVVWPPADNAYFPLDVETEENYADLYEDLVDTAVHSSDEDYQRLVGKLNEPQVRSILKVLVDADARKWYDNEPTTEASK